MEEEDSGGSSARTPDTSKKPKTDGWGSLPAMPAGVVPGAHAGLFLCHVTDMSVHVTDIHTYISYESILSKNLMKAYTCTFVIDSGICLPISVPAPQDSVRGVQAVTFWIKELQQGQQNLAPARRTEADTAKKWFDLLPFCLSFSLSLSLSLSRCVFLCLTISLPHSL